MFYSKFIEKISSRLHLKSSSPKYLTLRPVVIGGLILLLAGIGFYAYTMQPGAQMKLPQQDAEVVKQDGKIKITADTELIQRITYTKCKDQEEFRTKPPDNIVGLNLNQVQKIYSGWTIDKFDTKEVNMNLKVDSMCREHANNLFIGIRDGYVAVYYGVPGPKAIVKEVTKIPVNRLVPEDLQELHQGLVVQSKEELLRTLEGMQSR